MVFKMNRCEHKSIITYIIKYKLFVKHDDDSVESLYYKKNFCFYTFQVLFWQNTILLTLFEYDNDKRVSNIYKYTFDIHKITNDNPCNDAWKWILHFTKRIQYVSCGI